MTLGTRTEPGPHHHHHEVSMLCLLLSILAPRSSAYIEACEARELRRNPSMDHDEAVCGKAGVR